jgi:hypothetical protein
MNDTDVRHDIAEAKQARVRLKVFFIIKNDEEEIFINVSGLSGYGYNVRIIDGCHVEISYRNQPAFPVFYKKEIQIAPGATKPIMGVPSQLITASKRN